MRHADASAVRALIAAHWLSQGDERHTLGAITLRDHQTDALPRLRSAMREFGGALLADAVGLGKTYVALSLAREFGSPLVVAPAALRAMWHAAANAARVRVDIVSHESLSRATVSPARAPHGLLIVDEAHHARNPATRRYRSLAALAANGPVLLLTATPVHNRARDLVAVLALFLGARAWTLTPAELGRCIVRREHDTVPQQRLPAVIAPQWVALTHDEAALERLLDLPPPVPPSNGGDGGALLVHALLRRWASSDAALRATLRRRLGQATALADALDAGRYPTRSELRTWTQEDTAVQLALPAIVAAREAPAAREALRDAVRAHADGVRALLRSPGDDRHDAERAERLIELRARHAGEKIVAFSVFAETAAAMFRALRAQSGVALLSARGARIASGSVGRDEVLARFAPLAAGVRAPHARESIELLITTDLLSEGVNLQDASVVVHLDLPWTPARLEQRVGRVARMGSAHARISVYALSPPASAEAVMRVEQRLREKLRIARRSLGVAGIILPGPDAEPGDEGSAPGARERLQATVRRWQAAAPPLAPPAECEPLVAAVRAGRAGFLALLLAPAGEPVLVAGLGGAAGDTPQLVACAATSAGGETMPVHPQALASALTAIDRWREGALAERVVDLRHAAGARARRTVIRRIASIAQTAPPSRRAGIALLARKARQAATVTCGAGAERILAELAGAALSDEAWLTAVGTFGELHGAGMPEIAMLPELRALILLQ